MDKRGWIWLGLGAVLLAALAGGGIVVYENLTGLNPDYKKWLADVESAASSAGFPSVPVLLYQLQQESNFDPTAVSSAGAQGIAQFMPGTAAQFGIDPMNPTQSIQAQAQYMAQLYNEFGSITGALAAYNWGPGNLSSAIQQYGPNWSDWSPYAPSQTQNYVATIMGNAGLTPGTA